MKLNTACRVVLVLLLITTAHVPIFSQQEVNSEAQRKLRTSELPESEERRLFIEQHSFTNPTFRKKQVVGSLAANAIQGSKQIRMIYLVPSDKTIREDYKNAVANAILDLQIFFKNQLNGNTFSVHAPVVEVYQTTHPAAFYSSGDNAGTFDFWSSVLTDGFALSGGGFGDPNNHWIFYVDADPACGQVIGGGEGGVALLAANDFRGLTGQPNVPACPNEPPDLGGLGRWIGGLGHEFGHSFGVPHPPGCDQGTCTGGQFAAASLMWTGYAAYPNTYLLEDNKTQLLESGFFTNLTLDPSAKYGISGSVTNSDGGPVSGVSVTISETQLTIVSDANGNFTFSNLPAGGNYTVTAVKAGLVFAPASVLFNNLDRNQLVSFKVAPKISGRVTVNNVGLPGVTMNIIGSQSGTTVTDANGAYSFANLAIGGSYGIIPAKTNYGFNPQIQVFNQFSGDQVANFAATVVPGVPILISEENSTRALAVDAVRRLREPFQETYEHPWSIDRRTRIMLFATNFELASNETFSAVTAEAEDETHKTYFLPVEYVGKVPGLDWLNCVIVRLDTPPVGDVLVRIRYHGLSSNRVRVGVGHIGGGPADDADAIPTPGRPPH